jgi:hypothetical protein
MGQLSVAAGRQRPPVKKLGEEPRVIHDAPELDAGA